MTEGVDYSTGRPDLAQLWAAGKRFACRYLAYLPNGKVLSSDERKALHARGFQILLNWEQAAGDMLRGYDVGVAHAREALRQANALGAPPSTPIYFSSDVDTSAAQRLLVARYLDGCADVLGRGRVGVYGEADVIDAMLPVHATWGWQTYAWSGGRVSAKAHLLQYRNGVTLAGADLDLNRTLQANFGAWAPSGTPTEGADMNEEQWQVLQRINLTLGWLVQGAKKTGPQPGLSPSQLFDIKPNVWLEQLTAAAAADETRDNATLAAVRALTVATGNDPQPILDAIAAAAADTHAAVVQLQQQLAQVQARNVKQAQALAAAGVAFETADD